MPGDEDVIEDKPGSLSEVQDDAGAGPARLQVFLPGHATQEVKDGPGKCRFDGRELVPVTLSVFWTCAGDEKHLMEPGAAQTASRAGSATKFAPTAITTRGTAASSSWRRTRGTTSKARFQPGNVFRMFFYDNFTKPIPVKDFQARVVTREEWDPVAKKTNELEVFPLKRGRDGQTMEAPLKNVTLPLKAAAIVKFGANSPEQRFDFNFSELSKEPAVPPTPTTTSAAAAAERPSARNAPAAPAGACSRPAAATPPLRRHAGSRRLPQPPAPAARGCTAAPTGSEPVGSAPPSAEPRFRHSSGAQCGARRIGAADRHAGSLAELTKRAPEVEQMVNEGNLGQVWLPAMGTKTVALALGAHVDALPERQRAAATLAVKRVVTVGVGARCLRGYGQQTENVRGLPETGLGGCRLEGGICASR